MKVVKFIIIFAVSASFILQGNTRIAASGLPHENVAGMISKFQRTLFAESDPEKAIREYFYFGEIDMVDREFGLQSFRFDDSKVDALDCDVLNVKREFYSEIGYPMLHWKLGTEVLVEKSRFVDEVIIEDKSLMSIWTATQNEVGLTDAQLAEPDVGSLDAFSRVLTRRIASRIDAVILSKNLEFIDSTTEIQTKTSNGKTYYLVSNKLFHFTVTEKEETPRIVKFGRAVE